MKYNNINPKLTSELLEKSGFHFDGYYYASQTCPIKLLKSGDEFEVVINEAELGQRDKISQYIELIHVMHASMRVYMQRVMSNKKFKDINEAGDEFTKVVANYWNFDKDLEFNVMMDPTGRAAVNPGNVYTLSLLSNQLVTFRFNLVNDTTHESREVEIECCPEGLNAEYIAQVCAFIGNDTMNVDTLKLEMHYSNK